MEFGQAPYHRFAPSKQSSAGLGVFATEPARPTPQQRSNRQCPETRSALFLPFVTPVHRVS